MSLRARARSGQRCAARRNRVARVDRDGRRGGVAEIQRARMIAAMVEVARERGVARVTVAHVVTRSGVSRRTFYELFEDRDDCFDGRFRRSRVERAARVCCPRFSTRAAGASGFRAALGALLEFLDDEPRLGALCLVDTLGAGPQALARRARSWTRLIDAVDEGRWDARPD